MTDQVRRRANVFGVDEQADVEVDVARWVTLAGSVLRDRNVPARAELTLLFVDEATMAELNSRHMGATGPTDVLAFPIDDEGLEQGRWPDNGSTGPDRPSLHPDEVPVLLGDVVVCPTIAARQASEHAGSPHHAGTVEDEIALLVVHGILHVLGMDHADDEETAAMQSLERDLLARFHTPEVSPALSAVAALGLLFLAMVLAVCEVVLVHLGIARATTMADEGAERAETLLRILHRREATLGAVLVARLVAQVGFIGVVVALGREGDLDTSAWLAVAAGLVVVLAVVESLAKTVGLVRTEHVALRVTPVIRAVSRIPLLGLVGAAMSSFVRRRTPGTDDVERPNVSESELLALAEVAAEAEVIETSERALIESIIAFGDTIVREVMVPRPDMVTVEATWHVSDVMEVVILNGFSRIPVTGEGIDDVIGIAYAKDLMRAERDGNGSHPVGDHVRQARFVPEQQRVSALLPEMQSQQFHMAVVIDEYGGVAGLVTLEDLIEELIGEIVDEYDVEDPMAEPLSGGAYRVNARMPLDEVNDLLDADLPEGDWDTIGGLLFGTLGHVPAEGEAIEIGTHRLTAARVQGRRIGLVRIDRLEVPAPDREDSRA